MASNADGSVTLDFTIYTDDLSKQIDAANKSVEKFAKNTQKGMKATEKQIEEAIQAAKDFKIEPTAEGIEDAVRELDRLNAVIEISERQYGSYQRELERVSNKYGENSSQALRVYKNMLSLEASMDKNKKKSTEYANAISNADAAGFVRFNLFIGIICDAVCQRVFSLEAFLTQEVNERCGGAVVLDGDLAVHTDGETADLVGKAWCAEVFGFFAGVFSNGCDQLLAVRTADVVVDNHNV